MRTWMMVPVAAWLTLASGAEAGEFTCTIPWHSRTVTCDKLFSLRPQETVKIEVISVKDDDGKETVDCVDFTIADANTGQNANPLHVCPKESKSFKNENKETELIGRLDAKVSKMATRVIQARYTITSK